MKKFIALCLTLTIMITLYGCSSGLQEAAGNPSEADSVLSVPQRDTASEAAETDSEVPILNRILGTEGKIYNIYAPDAGFLNILKQYYADYEEMPVSENGESLESTVSDPEETAVTETGRIGDVTVRWHIVSNDTEQYEQLLDKALVGGNASSDEQVDLFLVDGGSVAKYCDSSADVSMPFSRIGLGEADLGQMYPFTKTAGSDENQVLRAVTWQVPCGLFVYRRSAALKILGTDDPEQVQEKVGDWDSFGETAASAAAQGYKMLSGYTDAYYVYLAKRKEGWVNDQDQLTVDSQMADWVHTTKDFTDQGYNNGRTGFHTAEWETDLKEDAQLFGTFLTASDISNYLIDADALPFAAADSTSDAESVISESVSENNEPESSGDWAVCIGPSSFVQGGEWICAGADSDNLSLTRDLFRNVLCNEDVMTQITETSGEMTNHMSAMKKIGEENGFGSSVFGDLNYIGVYDTAARECDAGKRTFYDHEINQAFMNAFIPYFQGNADEGSALNQFYTTVMNEYPDLSY